jgi:hypothetical protein
MKVQIPVQLRPMLSQRGERVMGMVAFLVLLSLVFVG